MSGTSPRPNERSSLIRNRKPRWLATLTTLFFQFATRLTAEIPVSDEMRASRQDVDSRSSLNVDSKGNQRIRGWGVLRRILGPLLKDTRLHDGL